MNTRAPHFIPVIDSPTARGSRIGQRPASTWAKKLASVALNVSGFSRFTVWPVLGTTTSARELVHEHDGGSAAGVFVEEVDSVVGKDRHASFPNAGMSLKESRAEFESHRMEGAC